MKYFAGYDMCTKLDDTADCDAHAVFGIATSDGGFAVAGKFMAAGSAPSGDGTRANHGGFVLKQSGDPRGLGLPTNGHGKMDAPRSNANPDAGFRYSQAQTWTGKRARTRICCS